MPLTPSCHILSPIWHDGKLLLASAYAVWEMALDFEFAFEFGICPHLNQLKSSAGVFTILCVHTDHTVKKFYCMGLCKIFHPMSFDIKWQPTVTLGSVSDQKELKCEFIFETSSGLLPLDYIPFFSY